MSLRENAIATARAEFRQYSYEELETARKRFVQAQNSIRKDKRGSVLDQAIEKEVAGVMVEALDDEILSRNTDDLSKMLRDTPKPFDPSDYKTGW